MKTIEVSKALGNAIVTREHGARLRSMVEKYLERGEAIAVDFAGLQIASVSFFDEAFGHLALAVGRQPLDDRIRFRNLDPFDDALLEDILASRTREAEKRTGPERLEEKGSRLGYSPITCEGCAGAGRRYRSDINAPGGRRLEDPCRACNGHGRTWVPRGRRVGVNTVRLKDEQIAELPG